MTNTQRIQEALARNPHFTDKQIAKNLGRHGIRVADVRQVRGPGTPAIAPRPAAKERRTSQSGRSLDAFRKQHDVSFIIDEHIKSHLHEKADAYFTDHEFREICGVPSSNWRRFADDTRFADHRLVRGQHNLWASKRMIQEMRKIIGI